MFTSAFRRRSPLPAVASKLLPARSCMSSPAQAIMLRPGRHQSSPAQVRKMLPPVMKMLDPYASSIRMLPSGRMSIPARLK